MTVTKTPLERALERKQAALKAVKIERILKKAGRFILSFSIPLAFAFILSAIGTFVFHANHAAPFSYNLWYFFCKSFFPSLPFMVWYISRK